MNDQSKGFLDSLPLPKLSRTKETPHGLMSNYIRLMDELRKQQRPAANE